MELFRSIRQRIGSSILTRKLSRYKREVRYTNISCIRKMGIVWDASKTHEFQALSRFYQRMNEKNIELRILGYFPGKELPDQYTALRYLNCLRRNELNFFFQPVSVEAESFINTKLDVLIDLNFDKLATLQYVSLLSGASFKVGLYDPREESSPFDLMMDIQKPVELESYLNHVMHYLEMINSEKVINTKTTKTSIAK
jgi:hypothetical protein